MRKQCFKCGEVKSLSEFYKHKEMADGHVNKCKECNKQDVRLNRKKKVEYYRKYDRNRGNRQDEQYRIDYKMRYPAKCRAHSIVNNAIRSGKLHREKCSECSSTAKAHAHHDDYLKPLNIRWLCPACHKAWHEENGEGLNATA